MSEYAHLKSTDDVPVLETGWASYNDSQYTVGSPLVVNQGITSTVGNNGNTFTETQLPADLTTLYDPITSKIMPNGNGSADGDAYLLRITFKAQSSSQSGVATLKININGAIGVISSRVFMFPKGSNTEHDFSTTDLLFTGSTFVANGETIEIESQVDNTSLYNINFLIARVHKAKV